MHYEKWNPQHPHPVIRLQKLKFGSTQMHREKGKEENMVIIIKPTLHQHNDKNEDHAKAITLSTFSPTITSLH